MSTNNTTGAASINFDSAENQRIREKLVHREVIQCVSSLVSHFAQNENALQGSNYSSDDLYPILSADDYENAARESDEVTILEHSDGSEYWLDEDAAELFKTFDTLHTSPDGEVYRLTADDAEELAELETDEERAAFLAKRGFQYDDLNDFLEQRGTALEDADAWRAACDNFGIEPQTREAYEHWTVSNWFADKLRERGEMIGELFGLTIWGRCTTGQSISMDSVIVSIALEMEILTGQANDWSK
jgi:hypothetical protein